MKKYNALALDLGSGSGRGILGVYGENGIEKIEEVYRFENVSLRMHGGLYWNYAAMYAGILDCLRECKKRGIELDSIGVDGWAQDYGYIGAGGEVLSLPRCYRDPVNIAHADDLERETGLDAQAHALLCGAPKITISTLRQLWYDRNHRSELFDAAKWYLHMPYLMIYLLTGQAACDISLWSIGELADIAAREADKQTLTRTGAWDKTPPQFVRGQIIGYTGKDVELETGYRAIPVICTEAHDTNSAVSAVPDDGEYLWISSGSYAMLGAVLKEIPEDRREQLKPYFQSPMPDGRICVMSGTGAGMYHIQQCMKQWKHMGLDITYPALTEYAVANQTGRKFCFEHIPDGSSDMLRDMGVALDKAGYPDVHTPFELYEAFCNSLAELQVEKLTAVEQAAGKTFPHVYVVGGGSKAEGVNIRLAQKLKRPVLAGLEEASATGNLLAQWEGLGALGSDWTGGEGMKHFRKVEA